jgi:peroxiredoxin Q/BCP
VIAWFPKAFTGGCTAECASSGASSRTLRQFNVAYFGASVDRPETNRKFAESMGIDFPILSDPGKSVARAYGVLGPSGFPACWTFYVGIDGRILQIDKGVRTGMHGLDIEKTLNELQMPGGRAPVSSRTRRWFPPSQADRTVRLERCMTLLDRFRTQSRDKHPDPAVRLAFVDELPIDDRTTIAAMAREDDDARVRRAAVAKLMAPGPLAAIARDDRDESVRQQAVTMLRDIALEALRT